MKINESLIHKHLNTEICSNRPEKNPAKKDQSIKIALIQTIPKSGTFLINKIFHELGIERTLTHFLGNRTAIEQCPKERVTQLIQWLDHQKAQFLTQKSVILIRDPRDNLVSRLNFFSNHTNARYEPYETEEGYNAWYKNLSYNEQLEEMISLDPASTFFVSWYSQKKSYERVLEEFQNRPDRFCIVKFEEIVPEIAGGNKQTQLKTIRKIIDFFGPDYIKKEISDEQIEKVVDGLYGGTITFNKNVVKKVGQWRTVLTDKHIELFKKYWNPIIIGLGYEKDETWGRNEA